MHWPDYIAYFFGGAFLTNAIPHFVSGVTGHPFQSPFAKPPGEGLSSSVVNVLWGWVNAVIAYVLIALVGAFSWHVAGAVIPLALGSLLMALGLAHHFGKFHGGNSR